MSINFVSNKNGSPKFFTLEESKYTPEKKNLTVPPERSTSKMFRRNNRSSTSLAISVLEENFEFYHAWTPRNLESLDDYCDYLKQYRPGTSPKSSSVPQHQGENSLEYSDGEFNSSDAFLNNGEQSSPPQHMAETLCLKGLPADVDCETLRDFFSVFGPINDVVILNDDADEEKSTTVAGIVTFKEGSDGAQKALDGQPIQMFGRLIEICVTEATTLFEEKSEKSCSKNVTTFPFKKGRWRPGYTSRAFRNAKWRNFVGAQQNDSLNPSRHSPFPLMVAPPNYGPWRQPCRPVSYLRSDRNSPRKKSNQLQIERVSLVSDVSKRPNSRERTMDVINAIAKQTFLTRRVTSSMFEEDSQRSSSAPQIINSYLARDQEFHHSIDDYSKGLRSNHSTDENNYSRSQNDLIPSRQNSSIHTLLSRSVHNPLFDDGNDYDDVSYPSNNNLQPMPSIHNEELDNGEFGSKPGISQHFHSDSSITSWIWAPNDDDKASDSHNGECEDDCDSETKSLSDGKQISHQTSAIERDLRCTLDWGRAVNASLPLLAVVSIGDHKSDVTTFQIDDGADQRDIESPKNQNNSDACWSGTNLYLLYKATEVTVRKNANIISAPSSKNTAISENKNEKNGDICRTEPAGTGHYTLYQARHPSLASLIAVKKCEVSLQDESDTNNGQNVHSTESIISVFDITPSQHRPLHEWLRTMDSDEYLNKPLFPGMEGHTLEPLGDEITQQSHSTQHHEHEQTSFSAIGVNHDQPNLCQCRRMSNRGISLHRSRQKRPKKRFSAGTAYRADVVDLRIRFLAMQIFHAVNFCHSRGITLGDQLRPDRMFVQDDGWIRLVLPIVCNVALPKRGQERKTTQTDQIDASTIKYSESVDAPADEIPLTTDRRSIFQKYEHAVTNRGQDSVQIIPYPGYGDVPTVQWQKGSITNLAYLMMLNAAAGRIVGDTTCPPIIPWVTDFTSEIDLGLDSQNLCGRSKSPWRDLSKTKFRLKKGDEQLDHTYLHADPAHHIPETISDLTYTVYRARCLPIHQLRSSVRDPFVPQHYPDSLAKLYEWTPDEATFEFYVSDSDPNIFYSRHSDMPDLSLPPWCENYEKFISYHRSILESGLVSRHLHMWIDLNFGAALSGERAITEKNVVLQRVSWDISADDDDNNCQGGCHSPRTPLQANRKKIAFRSSFRKSVFVQLFPSPHPKKHSNIRNSVSSVFYSALDDQPTQKIDENVLVNRQYVSSNDHTSLQSRKQRDVSMIGAIIQDCYRATRVAPPSDVVNAINELTFGRLDIRKSLEKSNSDDGVLFPFPNHARETYEFLASIQNVEFKRKQMNVKLCDNCDVTLRSSALSRQLSLIRNTDILNTLPISMVGLVMPSILPSLCSAETFVENFRSNRSFSSMADKICEFLIALSKRIPAELIVPHLLKFLESSFHAGNNNLAITEALGKIYLSNTLFSNLYSNSCGEYYIVWLSSFVTMQLSRCKPCTCNSMQETLQMTSVIVFFASLLAQDNLVGPSLCCRYIVPCFVESITKCSRNDRVNPVVQAMKSLLPYIPEDAVGVLICKPILRNIFPSYLPHYCAVQNNLRHHDKNIPESYDFLLDCIGLLRMCVRCLDSDNIVKYFLKSDSGTIVQILLSSFVKEIADKNAPTSRSEYQELNESSRSAEKQPDTLLKETSFLVRDMISHIDLDSINEVFSTIENYCSRVNDEYSTIAMGLYTNKLIDTENTMTLPGVATAVLLAGEMIRVCGREQLRLHCPSALELLTWVNSPEKLVMIMKQNSPLNPSSPKIIPNPSDDRNVASELSSPPRRNTSKTSIDEREGSSLEMRAPMRHNLFNSSIESGDEHRSQGSPLQQQMSGESSATNNNSEASMLFEQNEFRGSKPHNHARYSGLDGEAEKKRELAWVLGLNRRHKEGKVNYSWQPRMMISATLFQSRVNESVRSPIICMAANKPESMLAAGNSNGEILLFDLRRQPPSLICRNRVLDHRFPEHGRSPIKQVDFFDNVGSLLVCNGSLHHYDIETETIISSLSRKNAVLNTASHGNESWLGVDFVGFSNFPKGTGTEEMLHGAIGEVAAISTSHLYTIDLRSQNSVTHWHHLTGTDGHTNRHHKEPLFKSLTWYRESAPTKEHLKVYKGHGFTRLSKYEPNSFNLTCITAHCGGGDWVCVGSSSGHIHCFDRRQGKLLACWKAHSKSVEYLNAVSRHRLISASGDKTAVLWDLSHSPPLKVSRILNIPGKEQAMNVVSHQFRNDGLVSIPEGDLLLCAISGRKAVFQAMPHNSDIVANMFSENESVVDVKAERIVMCDCEGKRISSSEKFNISSVALLPCRQLVLLGCDGEIHVCL